mmetsp:Transcript_1883/g.4675  ORF Transcript_1883/g.4675 Transcript_1883/m.4675 type:complete len:127 (+) Transcript_1883:116-496(+)
MVRAPAPGGPEGYRQSSRAGAVAHEYCTHAKHRRGGSAHASGHDREEGEGWQERADPAAQEYGSAEYTQILERKRAAAEKDARTEAEQLAKRQERAEEAAAAAAEVVEKKAAAADQLRKQAARETG